MTFKNHETFHIRKGWLYKGLKNVEKDKYLFSSKYNEAPTDVLGIGSNMVRSLRYWLQATGLTVEPSAGTRYQKLTAFGEILYQNDRYMEELGTLWLLHYHLAKNETKATAWYIFFNHFNLAEFTKQDFTEQVEHYIQGKEKIPSKSAIEDDFACITNTYVSKEREKVEQAESNLECPLIALDLVKLHDKKGKTYRKVTPHIDAIHPMIALAVILDNANEQGEIKIQTLLNAPCNIGKVFNLDMTTLLALLYKLEKLAQLKVVRTAGLNVVVLSKELQEKTSSDAFLWCVQKYYRSIGL